MYKMTMLVSNKNQKNYYYLTLGNTWMLNLPACVRGFYEDDAEGLRVTPGLSIAIETTQSLLASIRNPETARDFQITKREVERLEENLEWMPDAAQEDGWETQLYVKEYDCSSERILTLQVGTSLPAEVEYIDSRKFTLSDGRLEINCSKEFTVVIPALEGRDAPHYRYTDFLELLELTEADEGEGFRYTETNLRPAIREVFNCPIVDFEDNHEPFGQLNELYDDIPNHSEYYIAVTRKDRKY